jgi:hypothetical protein
MIRMTRSRAEWRRFARGWAYGGTLFVPVVIALMPFLFAGAPDRAALLLVYAALPVYMIHQFEEHDRDRFRRFANALLRPRHAGLTPVDVLVINIALVWYLLTLAIVLAASFGAGWGLIAAYALLVNAVAHIGQGVALRRYNPGLWTAVGLFVPFGILIVAAVHATAVQHVVCLAIVLAGHAAILARALRPGRAAGRDAVRHATRPTPAPNAGVLPAE